VLAKLGAGGGVATRSAPGFGLEKNLSTIDELIAAEEIRQLKARYCAAIDDCNWGALRVHASEERNTGRTPPWPHE
jgi:hypothetical protein